MLCSDGDPRKWLPLNIETQNKKRQTGQDRFLTGFGQVFDRFLTCFWHACVCFEQVFDQALEGGGAKNINFQALAADLAQITFDYPFRIPPYFALIIRAIAVLEVCHTYVTLSCGGVTLM
jgi:hypothetical protein